MWPKNSEDHVAHHPDTKMCEVEIKAEIKNKIKTDSSAWRRER